VLAKIVHCIVFLLVCSGSVRAEDLLLRGPHPFNKENFLAFHGGWAAGFGDGPQGPRLQGDFQFRLGVVTWLDLQMGVLVGDCRGRASPCGVGTGNAVDILGGFAWNFQTDLPLVPFVRIAAGPIYLFPDGGPRRIGVLLRGGGGAHYFFYDWFGVGAEVSTAWGLAIDDIGPFRSDRLGFLDATLGAIWHF
jgi:hypothetical protein